MSKLKFFCVPQGGKQVWETMSNLFQYSLNIKYIYIMSVSNHSMGEERVSFFSKALSPEYIVLFNRQPHTCVYCHFLCSHSKSIPLWQVLLFLTLSCSTWKWSCYITHNNFLIWSSELHHNDPS